MSKFRICSFIVMLFFLCYIFLPGGEIIAPSRYSCETLARNSVVYVVYDETIKIPPK